MQRGSIAGRFLGQAVVKHSDHKGSPTGAQKLSLLSAYAKLLMTFQSNQGQTAKQVGIVSRGPGYSLFLTPTEAVIALKQNSTESKPPTKSWPGAANERKPVKSGYSVLRISLDGAAKSPAVTGFDPLPGKANYFIGNNPSKWHTNLPTYSRVKYRGAHLGSTWSITAAPRAASSMTSWSHPAPTPSRIQACVSRAQSRSGSNEHGDLMDIDSGRRGD